MIVYHGTTEIIERPDVNHSKDYLDFGNSKLAYSLKKLMGESYGKVSVYYIERKN